MDTPITESNVSVVTDCGRQFVNNPSRQPISQEKRDLIDKLLKERLALAAIDASHR